ncbi:MAG: T9SS type A sorting domain-containing protein, partial [bacterium]
AVNGGVGAAFFKDYGDTTVQAVVRHKATDGAAMVFFPVPFEAINHSTTRYLQKWTLIRRIFEWFGERVPGVAEELPAVTDKRPYVLRVSPSPVSGRGQVEFIAPVSGRVELRTYALDGQLVATRDRTVTFGERARIELDARELPAGTYLLQLVTPDGVFAQKATVVR